MLPIVLEPDRVSLAAVLFSPRILPHICAPYNLTWHPHWYTQDGVLVLSEKWAWPTLKKSSKG